MSHFRRREFIGLIGGAAAWPLAASAQQARMQVLGFVSPGAPESLRLQLAAFRDGLKAEGATEGQIATLQYRFAEGHLDRLPSLVADLVGRQVDVLVVTGVPTAAAAKQATSTIPIVFSIGIDPVEIGLVPALNKPGGNLTGVYQFATDLESKRLGLLHEIAPAAKTIAVLVDVNYPSADNQVRDVQEGAARLGLDLLVHRAAAQSDLSAAFSSFVQRGAKALLVCASPTFNGRREQLVVLTARHALPAMYEWRDFAAAGGLMSYGTSLADSYRQAGIYAGRILNGAKPADLPIMQLTRFEFVINLSTAKAMGVEVPPMLLARADEVIE
jgi:putative tryptophan/tyrosine transport system substrate-binding protein